MKRNQAAALPEKVGYTKYFEHDGALRAYANRMMWFGISAVLISFVLALLVFYVRVQPPTVIRIAADGEASRDERGKEERGRTDLHSPSATDARARCQLKPLPRSILYGKP